MSWSPCLLLLSCRWFSACLFLSALVGFMIFSAFLLSSSTCAVLVPFFDSAGALGFRSAGLLFEPSLGWSSLGFASTWCGCRRKSFLLSLDKVSPALPLGGFEVFLVSCFSKTSVGGSSSSSEAADWGEVSGSSLSKFSSSLKESSDMSFFGCFARVAVGFGFDAAFFSVDVFGLPGGRGSLSLN